MTLTRRVLRGPNTGGIADMVLVLRRGTVRGTVLLLCKYILSHFYFFNFFLLLRPITYLRRITYSFLGVPRNT